MSVVVITPNMNLPNPIPTTTPGPEWSYDVNACLTVVDSHDHSAGKGVQISPAGLNINSDLSFQGNNATFLRVARFNSQVSTIPNTGSDIGEIYVSGNELYYNDYTGGNIVQITNNGSVNAGAGSITGLPSGTASASFSAGTFTWQAATNTAATMDAGPYVMRNTTASSFGLTLQAPTLAGNSSITFPAVPISTKIMQLDASGNMSAVLAVDNSTLEISTNTLQVKDGGITAAKMATDSVATANIQNLAVTSAKLGAAAVTAAKLGLTLGSQTFTSGGTMSVPSTAVFMWTLAGGGGGGAGGGGGGATPGAGQGGGGGQGAPVQTRFFSCTPGDTLTVVVGAGGGGGGAGTSTSSGSNGTTGSSSTISGTGVSETFVGGTGGKGGVYTFNASNNSNVGGVGFSAFAAGGANGSPGSAGAANSSAGGGGGNGGTTGSNGGAGGAGGSGKVIIYWFA